MPGSWTPGRRIAMSRGSAERRGCPRRSGRCCGRSSSEVRAGLQSREADHARRSMFTALAAAHREEQEPALRLRRGGRGAGHQRRPSAVPRAPWAAIGPNALFFAGDLGQRIFQQPFSWKALGVDIRGRSRTLRVNYRTSHQIRMQADRLLGPEVSDVDGNSEDRSDTVSVFNGPPPDIRVLDSRSGRNRARSASGSPSERRQVCCRTSSASSSARPQQLDRARAAVKAAGMPFKILDEHVETTSGHVSISTMHLAKGLEFRAVVVMACDDEVIPLQERIETVGDDADLAGGLRHRAPPALCRLHASEGSSARDERRPGVGVSRRPADVMWKPQAEELVPFESGADKRYLAQIEALRRAPVRQEGSPRLSGYASGRT